MASLTVPTAANENANDTTMVTSAPQPPAVDVATPPPVAEPVQNEIDAEADAAVKAVLGGEVAPPKPTMQSSVAMAIGTNPDAEAEARRVALRTGVPVETVFAKPEEMKRKVALDDINFDTYQQMYPASALALTNVELAKIAHDDTENMGYTENVLRGIGQRAGNLTGGFFRTTGTLAQDISREADEYFPTVLDFRNGIELRHMTSEEKGSTFGPFSETFTQGVQGLEGIDFGYQPRTSWEDVKSRPLAEFLPFALEQGLVSTPDMVAAIFNAPVYMTSLVGDMGQQRAQNDERKDATVEDFIKVAPAALATALLERFATRGILGIDDAVKGFKEIPKAMAKAAVKEGVTESMQNTMQYASETVGTKKGFTWGEAGEQALQGLVAGGPFGGITRGVSGGLQAATERSRNRTRQAAMAEQDALDFEKLNALAAESKLKSRDPLAFQNFIEQVAQTDGAVSDVYVDPRALAQSGISLEELAKVSPSIADQVRVAIETGSDMKIPVSEYASHLAGTELGQAMVDHLKTNPLGMSRVEAKEFMQNQMESLRTDVEKTLTEGDALGKIQESVDTVRVDLLGQLTTANRFTKDVNEQYASLLSSFYNVQAARLGIAPEELYKQHPVDIKSTFDPGQTLSLNQDGEKPTFYSVLDKTIADSKVNKASGDQWFNTLKNVPGIKAEEMEWSGLPEWLKEQKGAVTKEQVQQFLAGGGVKLQPVEKGSGLDPIRSDQLDRDEYIEDEDIEHGVTDKWRWLVPEALQEQVEYAEITEYGDGETYEINVNGNVIYSERGNLRKAMDGLESYLKKNYNANFAGGEEGVGPTKFSEYQLPGGENYKELLLTLPPKPPAKVMLKDYGAASDAITNGEAVEVLGSDGSFIRNVTSEFALSAYRGEGYKFSKYDGASSPDTYKSSHFDEKNILAHMRFNERTDTEGKRVLLLEEVQSDWHQAGRKKGYKDEPTRLQINQEYAKLDAEVRKLAKERDALIDKNNEQTPTGEDIQRVTDKINELQQEQQAMRERMNEALGGVPNAPFKKTWHELAMKQMLRYAVDNGFDKVAWTTGEQQNDRYDLSKHIDRIEYEKSGAPDRYNIMVYDKSGKDIKAPSNLTAEQLTDTVGKEAAQKIVDTAGDRTKKLEGLDLKIGGDGMKGFYDKILPTFMNKYVKKWGSKVDTTDISLRDPKNDEADLKLLSDLGVKPTGKASTLVHSVEITPAMRDSVKQGQPLFQEDGMAARGSFNPDTNTITLLKNADLSTFLHESGHFFLEVMNKLAQGETAPDTIKADMQAVFDWLDVKDAAEWNSHDLEWQRERHEQFARGFEAYLFEGKSPSVEMRNVFQRFRAWLLNVYRQLSMLNVELNDEVRGVFDRMLATSEQIKETELARSFEPMFSEARAAGMTPDEWRQYQELGLQATQNAITDLESRSMRDMKFLSNARSRALKDLQREAAGRRREVREQVTKEIMGEPVNQAREFLARGKFEVPEDANQELKRLATETGLGSTKLSLPNLKEMYGEEANAPWRYLPVGKNGLAGTEGLHPDIVAEMFGFTSGDQLVREILAAENPKERIAALTDQRMLEKYGDLTSPEVLARAADEAVHNEVRARFVATELNALQRATGGKKVLVEAAKRFAEDMVNRLRVREIQPSRYAAAEARAAKDAAESFKAGGLAAAAVAKRNQLIQHFAARAAHTGLRDVEKAVQYFKKFEREGTRENIATSNLDQIDALLERFDLRKGQSLKQIDKRKSLLAWKQEQEDLGIEPEIPQDLLNEAMRKSYKDMTLEEIRGLRDTIKQLEHLGRLKNKLLTAKDNREFKATVDAMVASINGFANGRTVDNRTRATKKDAAIRLFKGFVASHRKVASLARELDGFKDGGPVWDNLIKTMNTAGDNEAVMRARATKDLAKLIKPLLAEGKMGGKGVYFKTIDKSLNREERIGIALNMGNLGNMQRLLDGEGWGIEQVRPVLDSLSKADWDFVQNVWDFFETFRPDIGAKEKRIYGKEPNWVDPNPVQTKFGELRGGYYPIKYDTRRSIAAEQHSDAEFAKQQMRGAYTSATTRRSFTKTRADEVKGRPLLYAMDGLYTGVNEIIHDLTWHEWLIDANRLLRNKALDGAIRNGYGAEVTRQFKDSVRDIAGGEMPNGTAFEKGVGDLRAGAMVAGLGLNIVNSFINLSGMSNSVVRVGPRWIAQGVGKFSANPRALTREVHGKSQFMRMRAKTMLREINEIQSQVRGKSRVRSVMDNVMFMPLTVTQMAVDMPTWYGAYQKALTGGETEERSIALADQAVLDSQSGGQVKDLAAIQRGPALMKLFTTFYGYFNAVYNLGVERTKDTDFKDPMSVLKLGGDYLMLYTVPVIFGTLIKQALMGNDDDWEPEKLAKILVNEQLSYMMGQMVGLREVTGAVQTVAGTSSYTASYGGPAGLRFFGELYNLATQIHQGEADEALRKSVINTLGIFFKLPAAQVNRTIGGVEALIDGETENPAAIVAGPPKK